ANKPFAQWAGRPEAEIVGRTLPEIMSPESVSGAQPYIERAFAGETVSYDNLECTATSTVRCVRVTLFPDHGVGSGGGAGAFAVLTDIGEDIAVRDALKAREEQLRVFADNIPGPVAYLDGTMRYTFVNQAFANWLGKRPDEIVGRAPVEVMPRDVYAFMLP